MATRNERAGKTKRLQVYLTPAAHKAMRMAALERTIPVSQLAENLLMAWLRENATAATKAALRETK